MTREQPVASGGDLSDLPVSVPSCLEPDIAASTTSLFQTSQPRQIHHHSLPLTDPLSRGAAPKNTSREGDRPRTFPATPLVRA